MPGQSGIQTDVLFASVIVRLERIPADINRRRRVDFQKTRKSAAVVVVSVGKNGEIDGGKVNAQLFRIFREQIGLTHVEQNAVCIRFDKQTQTVFAAEGITERGIFRKNGNFHKSEVPFGVD